LAWKIEFDASARRALKKLPLVAQRRIVRALDDLVVDPYGSRNVKALQGVEGYRLRVGELPRDLHAG
jgi:mRNA-degrading endonuclease RelE of RelBE toxin-antitoxin system